jgi:hypothetical protein
MQLPRSWMLALDLGRLPSYGDDVTLWGLTWLGFDGWRGA